jgi:hypothetical protein
MAVAEVTNLIIEKGTQFEMEFDLTNDDGTPFTLLGIGTATARIRKHANSTIYEDFSISTVAGQGQIKLSLSPSQTANLETGRNYFDLLIYTISGNPNTRQKFIKGSAIVEESMSL